MVRMLSEFLLSFCSCSRAACGKYINFVRSGVGRAILRPGNQDREDRSALGARQVVAAFPGSLAKLAFFYIFFSLGFLCDNDDGFAYPSLFQTAQCLLTPLESLARGGTLTRVGVLARISLRAFCLSLSLWLSPGDMPNLSQEISCYLAALYVQRGC